jgi:hypothetical protein
MTAPHRFATKDLVRESKFHGSLESRARNLEAALKRPALKRQRSSVWHRSQTSAHAHMLLLLLALCLLFLGVKKLG